MHYLTSLLTALALSVGVFFLIIVIMNLAIRAAGRSTTHFPVLPKYSPDLSTLTPIDFEAFVVERFDPGHFRLMRWSKKYSAAEALPEAPKPDLEYQALVHKQVIPFAVACVWNPVISSVGIDISALLPFADYRPAGAGNSLPVFLIIGIGGTQAAPAECFIVPMDQLPSSVSVLSQDFLVPFRRSRPASVLFLDPDQMMLR